MRKVNDRDKVIPGDFLEKGEKVEYSPYYFQEDESLFSSTRGMVRVRGKKITVIPSKGAYLPKEGDVVIAVVTKVNFSHWELDINSAYPCLMFERKLDNERERRRETKKFEVGDIISVKISKVDEVNFCEGIKPWKLETGKIMEVNPKRVPRVIGKKKSMLNLIKNETQSRIIVGQNGRIWIKGPKEELVTEIIEKIIREAQSQGLTNQIKKLLSAEKRKEN